MRIVLSTWGSNGDVQPILSLAERLLKGRHVVRVCTSETYRDRFARSGVDFYPVGVPFDQERFARVVADIVKIRSPLRSLILLAKELTLYEATKRYRDCVRGMEGHDIAICLFADIPGQEAAIKNGLPWVTLSFWPVVKTAYQAPYPLPSLGRPLNSWLWKAAEHWMRRQVDPLFNKFLISIGGRPRRLMGVEGMYSPELNLIAVSPQISVQQPDIAKKHRFIGALFPDEPSCEAPPLLRDFLDRGSRPIIVAFGSMTGSERVETENVLVEAVRLAGQRAIIQTTSGSDMRSSHQDIFLVGDTAVQNRGQQMRHVLKTWDLGRGSGV